MTLRDAATTLRKVSALRALCHRLPHVPTEEERQRLRRFDALEDAPQTATDRDIEALVAGWRRWWGSDAVERLYEMGERLPIELLSQDRRLISLWTAARSSRWTHIQRTIHACETCGEDGQISARARSLLAINVRQWTDEPTSRPTKLLVVSLAPPFMEAGERTVARSATNDPNDAMRRFLEETFRYPWDDLNHRGIALLHAVKCAIKPVDDHQNPPSDVVDACAPQHLEREVHALRPLVIAALGDRAYRAVVRALAMINGQSIGLTLTRPPAAARPGREGHPIDVAWGRTTLFKGGFPRGRGILEARAVLMRAATVAGLRELLATSATND